MMRALHRRRKRRNPMSQHLTCVAQTCDKRADKPEKSEGRTCKQRAPWSFAAALCGAVVLLRPHPRAARPIRQGRSRSSCRSRQAGRRHAGADRVATARRGIGAFGRGREPARRRGGGWRRSRGTRTGRRLYAVHGQAEHQRGARPSGQAQLRSRQGPRSDHPRRHVSQCAGGDPDLPANRCRSWCSTRKPIPAS